jgi:hypothetical protein
MLLDEKEEVIVVKDEVIDEEVALELDIDHQEMMTEELLIMIDEGIDQIIMMEIEVVDIDQEVVLDEHIKNQDIRKMILAYTKII